MLVAPVLKTDELMVARVQRPETVAHRAIPGDTRGTPGR